MVSISKVIEQVDGMTPNTFDEEAKFRWLATLDGMISLDVMKRTEPEAYEYPKDMDKPLLVGAPYEEIYAMYLRSMIDFHNREYDDYTNDMIMYQNMLEEFKAWYIRANGCCTANNFRNVMG